MVKWYPADDLPKNLKPNRRCTQNPTKLRGGVQPGQVLIILAGKHKGKRVVFLNQLPKGDLLVTGPYKLNGVPLKKISQSYTMPTSARVEIGNLAHSIDEAFFAREKAKRNKDEAAFFAQQKKDKKVPDHKKAAQNEVDSEILERIVSVPYMKKYLSTKFRLRNGMYPHQLKFQEQ